MKKHARILSLALAAVMAMGLTPASAMGYPDTYDVTFQADEVVEETRLSIGSWLDPDETAAPAYKDVESWYCEALDMTVGAGEMVSAYDFDMDADVVFEAEAVLPESFTLNFTLPNGVNVGSVVLEPEDFYTFFTAPAVDGGTVTWEAGDVTLVSGDAITGQDLDLDYVWYEKNPVLDFELTSGAEYPEAFTVKFIDDNDVVVSEQTVSAWDFYTAIDIPEGNWMCYRQRVLLNDGDYLSGQTLDLDFNWYGTHPVVEFYAN